MSTTIYQPKVLELTWILAFLLLSPVASFHIDNKKYDNASLSLWLTHGFLMLAGWAVFIPVGILSSLMRRYLPQKGVFSWFLLHRICLLIGFCCITTGIVLAVTTSGAENAMGHRTTGWIVYGLLCFQVLSGFIRPGSCILHHVLQRCFVGSEKEDTNAMEETNTPSPEATSSRSPSTESSEEQSSQLDSVSLDDAENGCVVSSDKSQADDEKSPSRKRWEVLHKVFGYLTYAAAWAGIVTGSDALYVNYDYDPPGLIFFETPLAFVLILCVFSYVYHRRHKSP